jgi:hypothetical protein
MATESVAGTWLLAPKRRGRRRSEPFGRENPARLLAGVAEGLENVFLSCPPSILTVAMIASEMPAAMRARDTGKSRNESLRRGVPNLLREGSSPTGRDPA